MGASPTIKVDDPAEGPSHHCVLDAAAVVPKPGGDQNLLSPDSITKTARKAAEKKEFWERVYKHTHAAREGSAQRYRDDEETGASAATPAES